MCIITIHIQLETTRWQLYQHYYKEGINIKNIDMGDKTQVKKEGGTSTFRRRKGGWIQKLKHHKETKFQEQNHQYRRRHIQSRAPIWHRKILELHRRPHQLHPTRILCRCLPQTSNPRKKSAVFGATDQTNKVQQSIRRRVWYWGIRVKG